MMLSDVRRGQVCEKLTYILLYKMFGDTVAFIVADHNLVFSLFRVLYEHVL